MNQPLPPSFMFKWLWDRVICRCRRHSGGDRVADSSGRSSASVSATEVSVVPVSQSSSISALRRPLIGGPCAHLVNWNGIELSLPLLTLQILNLGAIQFGTFHLGVSDSWALIGQSVALHITGSESSTTVPLPAYVGVEQIPWKTQASDLWARLEGLDSTQKTLQSTYGAH